MQIFSVVLEHISCKYDIIVMSKQFLMEILCLLHTHTYFIGWTKLVSVPSLHTWILKNFPEDTTQQVLLLQLIIAQPCWGSIMPAGPGNEEQPERKTSTSRAACRPSVIPQTTKLWPRRQSPAANTPGTLVAYLSLPVRTCRILFKSGEKQKIK